MRKVKYTPVNNVRYINLTAGKAYDVIGFDDGDIILIDDWNMYDSFDMYSSKGILEFVDMTSELRNKVIEEILE